MSRTAAPRITVMSFVNDKITGSIEVEAENLPGIRVRGVFAADLSYDEDAACWNCARNFRVEKASAMLPSLDVVTRGGISIVGHSVHQFNPNAGIVGELAHAFDRWLENASKQDVEQYAPVTA